jgi:hypothetical protein
MQIPPTAHFVWLGDEMPWVFVLALRSAASRGGFRRIVLHHEPALRDGSPAVWDDLGRIAGFEARELAVEALLGPRPAGRDLCALYHDLTDPRARATVVRLAVLQAEGGVSLDTDTLTLRDLEPLRAGARIFCGAERVARSSARPEPAQRVLSWARTGAGNMFGSVPHGWRPFRLLEPLYPKCAASAILASVPEHPFMDATLRAVASLSPADRRVPGALADVLNARIGAYDGRDLIVHPPSVFFPLPADVSAHWFRRVERLPALDEVLSHDTHVVHWYASGHDHGALAQIDEHYVRTHAERQLFSAVARAFVE